MLRDVVVVSNKKKVVDIFKELCIIRDNFTGKLEFNFSQGSIAEIKKTEKVMI